MSALKNFTDSKNQNEEQQSLKDDVPMYKFETLKGPDSIRVLQLHQTTGNHVECSIRQISFSEGGYQALSYVWGSEDRPFRANVRCVTGEILGYIPLTTNLRNALHDLRDAQELESKVFWIDQICIDQRAEEKNHQVKLMGQIFRNATRVITYVGPAATSQEIEKERMQSLERLFRHFEPTCDLLFRWEDLRYAFARRANLPVLALPDDIQDDEEAQPFWEWLVELVFGDWTTRLWIVQEQLLNSEIVVLRGLRLLCWDVVAAIPALFILQLLPDKYLARFWTKSRGETLVSPADVSESVFCLWIARRFMQRSSSPQRRKVPFGTTSTLLQNMDMYEFLDCHDPRDRIYALLAISTDTTELAITPDYSDAKSTSLAFLELSIRLLQTSKNLQAIKFACQWDNSLDLTRPSWALYIPRKPDFRAISLLSGRAHPRHEIAATPRILFSNTVLSLSGRILDRISVTTAPNYLPKSWLLNTGDESHVRALSQLILSHTKTLSSLDLTLENVSAMGRAIVADPEWPPEDLTNSLRSRVEEAAFSLWCLLRGETIELKAFLTEVGIDGSEVIDQAYHWINAIAKLVLKADRLAAFSATDALDEREKHASLGMQSHGRIRGRSLCITEGNRVCNNMHEAVKGDAVAAFEGTGFLYILRPVGSRYRLIGNAHVDGLMAGEAYAGLDPDEVDYDIELI